MEPITLIVTALVAGATAAAKETAGDVIKDAYKGLKALIQKRFSGKPEAESALAKHEEQPQVVEEPLKKALTEVGATEDETILKAAQKILQETDPEGAKSGAYNTIVHGKMIGTYQGNYGTQNFTYNEKD